MNVHHCQYQGMAFYMKKNRPVKLFVNSRIMVDTAYFREANPNYARASIEESDKESSSASNTYPYQEVPCLCPFHVCGSLAAAAAVHLVSSYLQSPPSTSIRPFRPFLESQPLRLRAEFLCSSVLCEEFFRSSRV